MGDDLGQRLVRPLWNADERRLRAPWRLLVQFVVLLVASVAVFTLAVALAASVGLTLFAGDPAAPRVSPVESLLTGVAVVGSVLVAARYVDRRTPAGLGLRLDRRWWRDLGAGVAIGLAAMTGVLLTELAVGWVAVVPGGDGGFQLPALLGGIVLMGSVGVYEEVLARGYWLTNLAEGLRWIPRLGSVGAVVAASAVTAAVFGALHAANPDATAASVATIAVAGVVFAGGYVLTGSLALPVGFHAAWNYAQAFGYGFPSSGVDFDASLVAVEQTGPTALTGGPFGPEGGLVGLVWLLLAGLAFAWWIRRTRGTIAVRRELALPPSRG